MDCDCSLYYLREFIGREEAKALIKNSSYPHVLLLSANNFLTWTCKVNHILDPDFPIRPFLQMPAKNFVCLSLSLTCHPDCNCYRGSSTSDIIVDCTNRHMKTFPKYLPVPSDEGQLIVSLEQNQIVSYPPCNEPGYKWLQHTNKLNLQHNELTAKYTSETDTFLRCLKNVSHLYLAYNNIEYLPMSIQDRKYTNLSISGNKLKCDCTAFWMKSWLQKNSKVIQNAITMHCQHQRKFYRLMNGSQW